MGPGMKDKNLLRSVVSELCNCGHSVWCIACHHVGINRHPGFWEVVLYFSLVLLLNVTKTHSMSPMLACISVHGLLRLTAQKSRPVNDYSHGKKWIYGLYMQYCLHPRQRQGLFLFCFVMQLNPERTGSQVMSPMQWLLKGLEIVQLVFYCSIWCAVCLSRL